MRKLIQNKLVWLLLFFVVLFVINYFQDMRKNEVVFANQTQDENVVENQSEAKKKNITEKISEEIMVDVKGAIKNPGVYQCEIGNRVYDVLKLAGGFKDKADMNKVNLAEKLVDEMVIYVPVIGEESVISPLQQNNDRSINNAAIDINHASQAQLENIPGIGPAKAKNIVDYIETNGPITSIDQLEEVNGIGKKSLEKMSPFIIIR